MTNKRSIQIYIILRVSNNLQTEKNVMCNSRYKSFLIYYSYIVSVIYIYILSDFVPKNKTTDRPELMKNSTQMIKLIIISTGSVMTAVLLIAILFTMCKGFSSANVCVNSYGCENVQVDNVYSEISWWRILKYQIQQLSNTWNYETVTEPFFTLQGWINGSMSMAIVKSETIWTYLRGIVISKHKNKTLQQTWIMIYCRIIRIRVGSIFLAFVGSTYQRNYIVGEN